MIGGVGESMAEDQDRDSGERKWKGVKKGRIFRYMNGTTWR